MGLDLRAIKDVVVVDTTYFDDESGEWLEEEMIEDYDKEKYFHIYPNKHFPNHCTFTDSMIIKHTDNTLSCRAGSYGGYGAWRKAVAAMFGNQIDNPQPQECPFHDIEGAPFNELLNFSDCDGVINGEYLHKIQLDFTKYYNLAKEKLSEYDFNTYCRIKEVFDYAGDGLVYFY